MEWLNTFIAYSKEQTLPKVIEIFSAPLQNREVMEIIAPLFVTLLLVQIYFGRHRDEELGWETAYGNCIVLIFVTFNLLNYLYESYPIGSFIEVGTTAFYKALIVGVVLLQAITLFFIDYAHSLPKKVSFVLSSGVSITVTAFIAIVLVRSDIAFNRHTIIAALYVFLVVYVVTWMVRHLIKPSQEAQKFLEKKAEERREKEKELRRAIKQKIISFYHKFIPRKEGKI